MKKQPIVCRKAIDTTTTEPHGIGRVARAPSCRDDYDDL